MIELVDAELPFLGVGLISKATAGNEARVAPLIAKMLIDAGLHEKQPYKSDFFSFMYAFFWVDQNHKFPTSHTLGNATLRVFGLQK